MMIVCIKYAVEIAFALRLPRYCWLARFGVGWEYR
jgi:hypothetical protein